MAQAEEEKKEDQAPKPSSKKKMIILIAVVVLVLAGGGAGAYYKFFMAPKGEGENHVKEEAEPIIKEMDTFIVNLADPGGKRFLKLTMKARVDNQQALAEFGSRVFEMRDLVLMVLAAKEVEDITRPEDRQALKQELAGAMNRVMKKGRVQDIYFTEFLIQ